jgi:hypothetical protein
MAIKIGGTTVVDDSRNLTNVTNVTATGNVTLSATGFIKLPSGTTDQRPTSPTAGMARFNTSSGGLEIYNGTEWLRSSTYEIIFGAAASNTQSITETTTVTTANASTFLNFTALSTFSQLGITYTVTSGSLPTGLELYKDAQGFCFATGTTGEYVANTDFTVTVKADDGNANVSKTFNITVIANNDAPVWTTPAGLLGNLVGTYTFQLAATDPEGNSITYSRVSGSLPSGATLNSNGLITASTTADTTLYSFTVRASDGGATTDRAFTIFNGAPSLGTDGTAYGTGVLALGGRAVEYWTTGTHTFTMPVGLPGNSITAVAIGGGKGGSSGYSSQNGAGGGSALRTFTIPGGSTAAVVVGTGGTAGIGSEQPGGPDNGGSGTSSTFTYSGTTITGTGASSSSSGATGSGGTSNFTGGNTSTGFNYGGGGGAGSGGNGGAANPGTGQSGSGTAVGTAQPSAWVSGSGGGGGGVYSSALVPFGARGGTASGANPGSISGWGTANPANTYSTNPMHGRFSGGGGGAGPNTLNTGFFGGSPGGGGAGGHVGPGNPGGQGYVLVTWL